MNDRAPISTVTSPAAALRLVRIMKIAFVVSAILFLGVIIRLPANAAQPPDFTLVTAITVVAFADVVLGFVFPRSYLRTGRRAPGDVKPPTPIQRWFTANVIGFAFLESCSLFGVMLHFLGAELRRSELLIGVGIIATIFFSLGTPPGGEEGNIAQG